MSTFMRHLILHHGNNRIDFTICTGGEVFDRLVGVLTIYRLQKLYSKYTVIFEKKKMLSHGYRLRLLQTSIQNLLLISDLQNV